jgi:hypothetical protein
MVVAFVSQKREMQARQNAFWQQGATRGSTNRSRQIRHVQTSGTGTTAFITLWFLGSVGAQTRSARAGARCTCCVSYGSRGATAPRERGRALPFSLLGCSGRAWLRQQTLAATAEVWSRTEHRTAHGKRANKDGSPGLELHARCARSRHVRLTVKAAHVREHDKRSGSGTGVMLLRLWRRGQEQHNSMVRLASCSRTNAGGNKLAWAQLAVHVAVNWCKPERRNLPNVARPSGGTRDHCVVRFDRVHVVCLDDARQ